MTSLIDIAALKASDVAHAPFDHVVVRNFVSPAALARVVADLPDIAAGGSFPTDALRLGPAAAALMDEMAGIPLQGAIATKFGLKLDGAPTMVTLRGRSREKDGRIHRDSDSKRVTVLLYLNPASAEWATKGGSLRLLRNDTDIEAYEVEVPPTDGTLLVFPNGPATWHGHKQHVGKRYVIQLNYMTADARARQELRRHRWSAMVKRLTGAATRKAA